MKKGVSGYNLDLVHGGIEFKAGKARALADICIDG
jgi:hypothetical protein